MERFRTAPLSIYSNMEIFVKRLYLILVLSISAFILNACILTNPVTVLACTEFEFRADNADSIIDNSGINEQLTILEIRDGQGTLLFRNGAYRPVGDSSGPLNIRDVYTTSPEFNPLHLIVYSPAGVDLASDRVWYSAMGECPGLPYYESSVFGDGRINNQDPAAPFAVYLHEDDLHFYWVINGVGTPALVVTQAEMEAIKTPDVNTLIASNEAFGLYVYRLTDGGIQAQARTTNGKLYVIIISDIYDRAYTSFEEE